MRTKPIATWPSRSSDFTFQVGTPDPDRITGQSQGDLLVGLAGEDTLEGNDGFDILIGGTQDDVLDGGNGFDILIGGLGGDSYIISTTNGDTDLILDNGDAPVVNGSLSSNLDRIELSGFASQDQALHSIGLTVSGDDLILDYDNDGATGQIIISDHFAGPATAIEVVNFGDGPDYHVALLSGDQYTYSVHSGPDAGGEDIVLGTAGADEIYGGLGGDILAGFDGADHFMFHDEEEGNGAHDLILDFDPTQDRLDFTDIAGFGFADIFVTENAWGNAVVGSIFGEIELAGIAAADVTADFFAFA